MTDEFFVAVTEFNLSWDEIKALSQNSLQYAFVPPQMKQQLLRSFADRMAKFERDMKRNGVKKLGPMPETRRFICAQYDLCS